MTILILILGIILFIGLIVIHELGHFIVARRNGVEAEEFGIFFPPTIYKKKMKGGWTFSINALPLGGFVKLKGEHDSDTEKGSYGAASLWVKSKIMLAGVTMNLLTALVLLTILAWVGIPNLLPNQYKVASDTKTISQRVLINDVESGSPAAKAGLKNNDQITSIGLAGHKPTPIKTISDVQSITKRFNGDKVNVYFNRDGKSQVVTTTLLTTGIVSASQQKFQSALAHTKLDCANIPLPKGYLGISMAQYSLQRSTWSAPITAVGFTVQATGLTLAGLGHALGGLGDIIAGTVTGNKVVRENGQCTASSQVAGPVGIFVILKDSASLGLDFMLFLIAIISLTLAIMNVLPIPALDGGRLWLTLITRAIKKPLSPKREEAIVATGMAILLCLMVLITIVDVNRFL
ncbi:MAG TPA: M50 family metallopeptidase [Candidatus Saccharimonadales bacterium]|nr:M50 family metallopeptidase [Candidatus Saccharimonadales bacterium]